MNNKNDYLCGIACRTAQELFVSGRFKKDLPMQIVDPKGNAVCEIRTEDPERWFAPIIMERIACTRKLCTRSQWDKDGHCAAGSKLCDCWEALAVDGISGCRL